MAAETKFTGTDTYVASDDLLAAVEVATKLQKPLLVKGYFSYAEVLSKRECGAT